MAPKIYDYKEFYRRKLPHFHPFGATLFVTFRLHGSVPKAVVRRWQAERELLEKQLSRHADSWTEDHEGRVRDFHRRWFREFEEVLHRAACGPTWLKDERIARVVADSLRHRDGTVYRLDAYCI